jgi:hypothetical protein
LADSLICAGDAGTFEIVPKLANKSTRWPQSVTLTMSRFSAAYAGLRKACDDAAPATLGSASPPGQDCPLVH